MTSPLQAAQQRRRELQPADWEREPWPLAFDQLEIEAFLVAVVGCPKCKGTGDINCEREGHQGNANVICAATG